MQNKRVVDCDLRALSPVPRACQVHEILHFLFWRFLKGTPTKTKTRITHAKHKICTWRHLLWCYNMLFVYCCEFGACLKIFSDAKILRTYWFRLLVTHVGTKCNSHFSTSQARTDAVMYCCPAQLLHFVPACAMQRKHVLPKLRAKKTPSNSTNFWQCAQSDTGFELSGSKYV